MGVNPEKTRLGNYSVVWAGNDINSVDNVVPDLDWVTKEIKVGSVGDVPVGERFIRLGGKITAEAREIDIAFIRTMFPWYVSGSARLTPATKNVDLYIYADLLTLHPLDVSGTAEDINILKAFPTIKPMARDGMKDDKVLISWRWWPLREDLPDLNYGYYGPVPS